MVTQYTPVGSITRLRRIVRDLVRQSRLDEFEPRLALDGYTNVSAIGRFKECLTDRRFIISEEGQHRKLETTYAKTRLMPIESLLATIEAGLGMA